MVSISQDTMCHSNCGRRFWLQRYIMFDGDVVQRGINEGDFEVNFRQIYCVAGIIPISMKIGSCHCALTVFSHENHHSVKLYLRATGLIETKDEFFLVKNPEAKAAALTIHGEAMVFYSRDDYDGSWNIFSQCYDYQAD